MDPNELVARIRRGDVDDAIDAFLEVTPEATLEMLAVNAMNWQMFDVAEPILHRMLREEPDNLGAHLTLAKSLYGQKRFADALPHFEFTVRHLPDDPWYQSGRCWGHSQLNQPDDLRRVIIEAKSQLAVDRHINWQHARQIRDMPEDVQKGLETNFSELRSSLLDKRKSDAASPCVATWQPRAISQLPADGINLFGWSMGLSVNRAWFLIDDIQEIPATSAIHGDATVWSAAFVPASGAHHRVRLCLQDKDQQYNGTDILFTTRSPRDLKAETGSATENGTTGLIMTGAVAAGGDAAEYRFEFGPAPDRLDRATPWQALPGRRNGKFVASPEWTASRSWYYGGDATWEAGKTPNMTVHWPFAQDPNHISGIGFMELLYACWHNSNQHDGYQRVREWECSDLRDAEITLQLRPQDLDTKTYLHCLGIGNVETYWMLTGQAVDLSTVGNGDVELTFHLPSDPTHWTYAGNNQVEQPDYERYKYGPLDSTLARNQGNLVLIAPFGTPSETTTGAIAFGQASVTYRDNNILHPDNGARLIEAPNTSPCDPTSLSNGIYGDPDAGWFHYGNLDEAPRFVWDLGAPRAITTLVIHQDPVLPTTKCRVSLSDDTGSTDSWDFDIPVPSVPHDQLLLKIATFEGSGTYTRAAIELLEGMHEDGRGLQSFEIFAKDFTPPPSDEPVTVSADGINLHPGSQVHYRIVTRAGEAAAAGEICTHDLPQDGSPPLLHQVELHSMTAEKAIFQLRANAMNHPATIQWKHNDGEWQLIPLGWEQTPVHRYIVLDDLTEGNHRLTVQARSDAGESPELIYDWHTSG